MDTQQRVGSHAEIGRLLGYPECCVDQWNNLHGQISPGQAIQRGCVDLGLRPQAERDKLAALFSQPACAFARKIYVPCDEHIGTKGWRPYGKKGQ